MKNVPFDVSNNDFFDYKAKYMMFSSENVEIYQAFNVTIPDINIENESCAYQ